MPKSRFERIHNELSVLLPAGSFAFSSLGGSPDRPEFRLQWTQSLDPETRSAAEELLRQHEVSFETIDGWNGWPPGGNITPT